MRCTSAVWLVALLPDIASADDDATATLKLPVPLRSYVRLEPSLTMLADGATTSELLARALLVYRGWLVPGVGPESAGSALRVEVSLLHVRSATGIGDVELMQLSGHVFSWGSIGSGLALVVPTATPAVLGGGNVRLGPALYAATEAIPRVTANLVSRSLFAIGSGSTRAPALATVLEPTLAVELTEKLCLTSNGQIEIDWLAGTATVPVNLRVGRSFGRHWYVELGPEIDVTGPNRGDLTLDLELDYLE